MNPGELSSAYRAVWRWHFYAGVIVLPFLMLMALTGGVYLFRAEIDDWAYGRFDRVATSAEQAPPDRWLAAAASAGGGAPMTVTLSGRSDRAAQVVVERADGTKRTVFVDPHTGRTQGVVPFGGVSDTIKRLHSLVLVGPWANYVVEIVAGWAIVLFATGLFLWWPRRRAVGVVALTSTDMRRRPFWRDVHALTGVYVGAVVAFLAVTGMPWSAFWGGQYMAYVKAHGLGRPKPPAGAFEHAHHGDGPTGVGWTMEGMVMPVVPKPEPRLSTVLAAAEDSGLAKPFVVSLPKSPAESWTAARAVTRVEDNRILYIDAATGVVKADVRWNQFGVGAKAFEWGIAVHQGTQYGWINRYLMLAACIGVWVLGISGVIMWWMRRPRLVRGEWKAPAAPPGARVRAAVLGIVVPLCILYPLTGLSLLAALGLDRLVGRLRSRGGVAA